MRWGRDFKAFSLLEVIVGTFVFLVVVGALQGYWVRVGQMMEKSRVRMAAGFVAEQLLEDIVAKGYEGVGELAQSGSLTLETTMNGREKHYAIRYSLNIVDVDEETKSVQVSLGSTGARELRFETLLYKDL